MRADTACRLASVSRFRARLGAEGFGFAGLVNLRRDDLGDLAQPGQFAAVRLAPRFIAQPLRRMIADLLEAHQRGEHDAATLHSVGSPELSRQIGH